MEKTENPQKQRIEKSDDEWRKQLSDQQYRVTRESGTEPAFTGKYWNTKDKGTYNCVCCGAPLFQSETKFDSGTGWPSFYKPVDESAIAEHTDRSYGMTRTEARCAKCDAHLGHVFPDGPNPTGLRYCMNSASLDLKPEPGKEK
jgi:peptide-methionine (R)-S-oxide reductase